MQIIIPMAGEGTRFPKDKYPHKPLIEIEGKPMIQRAIESLDIEGKYFFVIRNDENLLKVSNLLHSICDCEIISINQTTKGPACTALLFEERINKDELVIANCDQIMWWNSDLFLKTARTYDGCIVTYTESTDKNSYCLIDKQGLVTKIKEKEVISDISLTGIHYWKNGIDFVNSAKDMISHNDIAPNGEFYVGPTYNYLNKPVGIYHIPNFQHNPVGVPEDLDKYNEKLCKYLN